MKKLINILITFFIGLILYYFLLPPLNLKDPSFYTFIIILLIIYFMLDSFSAFGNVFLGNKVKLTDFKFNKIIYVIPGLIVIIMIINFICSPLFNAKSYSQRITVTPSSFTEDVPLVDFNSTPLLDRESTQNLGDRKMGSMTELVSQFSVSNRYTQINYNNDIIRVTPLEYASIIKYFTNRSEGIKGYITVNSVDGSSELVRLENGMRYMESSLFFENLDRKLRISYPTKIFGEKSFEIDNEGNPYWIVQTLTYTGIGLKKDVTGVVILDPITGDSEWYKKEEIPTWIDHVYDANLIIEQFNNYGEYKNGFFNSLFGQKGVVKTTDGYNYLAINDDIYLYTGVTSVISDESNIGFILSNMRTKETHYYEIPGAEEFSAMDSAEGLVQEKDYKATFPLLINLNNKPTYLMSLKDDAGLVKMYAFVDVADYQKVVTSDASLGIEVAANKYLSSNNFDTNETLNTEIQIKSLKTAVIEGTTYYYIKDIDDNYYSVSIKVNEKLLPFLEINDKAKIEYYINDNLRIITKIS